MQRAAAVRAALPTRVLIRSFPPYGPISATPALEYPSCTRPYTVSKPGRLLIASAAVSKVCYSCGKGPAFGHSRSHSMVATKRRFNPNLQKVRISVNGTPRREYVCTRCLKASKVTKAV